MNRPPWAPGVPALESSRRTIWPSSLSACARPVAAPHSLPLPTVRAPMHRLSSDVRARSAASCPPATAPNLTPTRCGTSAEVILPSSVSSSGFLRLVSCWAGSRSCLVDFERPTLSQEGPPSDSVQKSDAVPGSTRLDRPRTLSTAGYLPPTCPLDGRCPFLTMWNSLNSRHRWVYSRRRSRWLNYRILMMPAQVGW